MISFTLISALTAATSLLMLIAYLRPMFMLRLYMVCRPAITPFAFWQYSFFGIVPIGTPYLAIVSAGGILTSLGTNKSLCPPGLLFIYAYLLFSLPSLLVAPGLISAFVVQTKATVGIAAYLVAFNHINSRKDLTYLLLSIVLLSSFVPFIYGFYQYITSTSNIFTYYWPPRRITSVFVWANAYGEYLNVVMFLILGMLFSPHYKKQRKWLVILLALAAVQSMFSQNRGAWLGFVAGMLAAMLIYRKVLPIKWVLMGGLLVAALGGAFILARFEMLSQVGQWGHSQNTLAGRFDYFEYLLGMALENPLVGKGLGFFDNKTDMPPHNDYLWVFVESGILAAICYILFIVTNIFKHLRNRNTKSWRWAQFSFCAITIYFFIHSWMQNIFNNPSTFPFFMACMGAAAKLMLLPEESEDPQLKQNEESTI